MPNDITDFATVLALHLIINSFGRKLRSAQILRKTTRGRSLCFLCTVPDKKKDKKKECARRKNAGKEGSAAYFSSLSPPRFFVLLERGGEGGMMLFASWLLEDAPVHSLEDLWNQRSTVRHLRRA